MNDTHHPREQLGGTADEHVNESGKAALRRMTERNQDRANGRVAASGQQGPDSARSGRRFGGIRPLLALAGAGLLTAAALAFFGLAEHTSAARTPDGGVAFKVGGSDQQLDVPAPDVTTQTTPPAAKASCAQTAITATDGGGQLQQLINAAQVCYADRDVTGIATYVSQTETLDLSQPFPLGTGVIKIERACQLDGAGWGIDYTVDGGPLMYVNVPLYTNPLKLGGIPSGGSEESTPTCTG